MAHKPNETPGSEPVENALYYKKVLPDGTVQYAMIIAYEKDSKGRYKAWVSHPVYGVELMTPREGRLDHFIAIKAVTEDALEAVLKITEGRIAALEERLAASENLVSRLQSILGESTSVEEPVTPTNGSAKFTCSECGKVYGSRGGLEHHLKTKHPTEAVTPG